MSTKIKGAEKIRLDDPDTNNATRIGWFGWSNDEYWSADHLIPEKTAYFRQLDRYNSGLQNGPTWQNKRYETFWLDREEIFTLGSQLEMPDWQRHRASQILTGKMRSELGLESTLVLLSLCGYVLHDSDGERKCHPQTKDVDFDDEVDRMLSRLSIRQSNYDKTYRKIQRIDTRDRQERTERRDENEMDLNSKQMWGEIDASNSKEWL